MTTGAFRKELTVLAGDVTGGPLTDFPVLVSITDTDLKDNARADGFDIFFTESDGTTVIPYERESYDSSTGELIAWVLVDLSDTVDNNFFMFYGNPNATDQQDPLPVWDTRFEDVFHFNQTSPLPWDNSSVGKDFTFFSPGSTTNPSPVVGQIDTASDISVTTNVNEVSFRMGQTGTISPTDFFASAWLKFDAISTDVDTFLDCWESHLFSGVTSNVTIGSGVQGAIPDNEKIELIIVDDNNSVFTEILIGDMADLAYHHVAIRYLSGTFDLFFDGSFVSSTAYVFIDPVSFDASSCGAGFGGLTTPQTARIDQLQVAHTGNFSNGFITTSFDNQKTAGQGAGNFVKVGQQQIIISNNYLVLSQGPINNESSSIINAVCGDSSLLIGDVVRLLPLGTGEGFTQSDDILPRVGIPDSLGTTSYGIVVGGDFEGVYSDGVLNLDSNNLALGAVTSFFGDGVRICTQGRCLALANNLTGSISIGDKLTSSTSGLVKAFGGDEIIATALQSTSDVNNIIAVDIQREGKKNILFKKQLTVLAADVTGASSLTDFPLLVSITDTDLKDNARSDGFDIFFTESDGTTVIPYERESYDSTTGELIAWVLVDLSDTVDNNFFMFYGNPNATDQQDPLPVWNTRFQDVFHFNQTSPLPWDNSSVGKDFTILPGSTTNPSPVVGQIDTASDSSITTDANTIVMFRMASTGDVTPSDFFVSAWIKYDIIPTSGAVFYDSWTPDIQSGGESAIIMGSGTQGASPDNDIIELVIFDPGFISEDVIGDMSDLAYHHVVIRYLSGTFDLFFDGSLSNSIVYAFNLAPIFNSAQCGGGGGIGIQTGRIDELQVAHTGNFSNGFITTSFDNQKDSGQGAGNFVKVGAQEVA